MKCLVITMLSLMVVGCSTIQTNTPNTQQEQSPSQPPSQSQPSGGVWPYAHLVEPLITTNLMDWKGWERACPKYLGMQYAERKTALVAILGGIAMAESGQKLNPKPFREPNQGLDPVTKLPTYSEGLFQLSYKDAIHVYYRNIPVCASISYEKKNINDGEINAGCAIGIMKSIISRGGDIKAYWSSFNPARPGFKTTVSTTKKLYPDCF